MRLFLAINLPFDVRRDIVAATGPLRECAPELGWVDEARLHLTLKFLDDQPAGNRGRGPRRDGPDRGPPP